MSVLSLGIGILIGAALGPVARMTINGWRKWVVGEVTDLVTKD